ncbi:MAG: PQQ-binding-like beta-propeller repeat protein [Candidatus Eisenbacteria bacterium]|nr:PQQ-binding-like beta-propeller repeat protein [Candidatus Eisenbacteria bacterium]
MAAFGATTGELLPWNPGTSNSVWALAAAEGEVYVAGGFSTAAGQPRARIARFSSATGLLDPWAPAFKGLATAIAVAGNRVYVGGGSLVAIDRTNAGLVQPELPAFYGYVRGLSAQAGRLLVVGEMAVGGSETRKGLAAFDTRTRALLPWGPDINGAVRAITARDGVLWLGGDFTQVDGAGRSRLAALDAATCTLLPQAPACDGRVLALALSNGTLYAGGDIALANGTARSRLAAFDAATGALLPWNPGANYSVKAFALGESTLYVGGEFTSVAGVPRTRLAAFDLTNGNLLPWAPTANIAVRALALDRDQLFIGGQFTQVNGQPRLQLAALDASSGALRTWVPDAAFAARLGPIVYGLAVIGGSVVAAGDGSFYEPACECNWPRGFALGLDIATGAATTAMADFESAAHSVVGMPGSAFVAGQFGREYAPGFGNCAHLLRMHVAGSDPMFQGTVLEPIAGRPLAIGSVHRFEWRSEGAVFGAQSADLYLSRGGPLGPWEPIAIGVSGRDSYDWTVAGPDAAQAYLWVDVRDAAGRIASDVSDGAFSIGAAALDAPPNTPANTVALEGPLPNPLRGRGTLRYVVPRTGLVSLGVFDILGREVRALVAGNREAGSHSVALGALPRGLYFVRLATRDGTISKRFVVLD